MSLYYGAAKAFVGAAGGGLVMSKLLGSTIGVVEAALFGGLITCVAMAAYALLRPGVWHGIRPTQNRLENRQVRDNQKSDEKQGMLFTSFALGTATAGSLLARGGQLSLQYLPF